LAPQSWGISFNPQRSWASLFRAFLLPGDRKTLADSSLRSCTSGQNLHDLAPVLQRLPPTQKAVPLLAPQVFSSGRDLCSLELSNLSGSPSAGTPIGGIFTPTVPSHSYEAPTLRFGTPMSLRVFKHQQPGSLPITGRRPVWPSRSRSLSHPFEGPTRDGLFFHLEALKPLRAQRSFSLPPVYPLLAEGGTAPRSPT
jgi:hypothetical protein